MDQSVFHWLVAFTDRRWQLLNSGGSYQSAGDDYSSTMSFTNPRNQIRWSKQTHKKVLSHFFWRVHLGTLTILFTKQSQKTINLLGDSYTESLRIEAYFVTPSR